MSNLLQAVLHRIDDRDAKWTGAKRKNADYTDKDLAEAEDYRPPAPRK